MVEEDLGTATIVYEEPDEGTVEQTVQNEHIAYFQDHWVIKMDEETEGWDRVRRIPHHRVYHVERSVDEFENEVMTVKSQIKSMAEDLQQKFIGGDQQEQTERETHQIEITSETAETDDQLASDTGESDDQ